MYNNFLFTKRSFFRSSENLSESLMVYESREKGKEAKWKEKQNRKNTKMQYSHCLFDHKQIKQNIFIATFFYVKRKRKNNNTITSTKHIS